MHRAEWPCRPSVPDWDIVRILLRDFTRAGHVQGPLRSAFTMQEGRTPPRQRALPAARRKESRHGHGKEV